MNFQKTEQGQGLVEYSLLLILIAMVVIIALTFLGTSLSTLYSEIVEAVPV